MSWSQKCKECNTKRGGRCSFEESPEERMDSSEAAFSWGRDSLSCKSLEFFSLLYLLTNW